ncbi:MAG: hypothetical protein HC769_23590 [Cyanobacteria bacterium CRU_2_1]|nr:hypothetical protein [Cyanobacteria bacterium RU_5_0]NJR61552.1 hypothetical protein [Cyanobacteria bacterium CRU_2_1]
MDIERIISNRLLEQFVNSIITPIQDWLTAHPVWNWLLTHPLWLIGLILLILFLVTGLIGAIARLTEAIWLAILQAPLKLIQWLLLGIARLLKIPFTVKKNAAKPTQESQQERLAIILNRLETLKREQDELLQEVRVIFTKDEG